MPLPFARPRLDVDASRSLTEYLGSRPRILAWSRTTTGLVVGLTDRFVEQVDGTWTATPWHHVQRGQWDEKTAALTWTDHAGLDYTATLESAGRFPELFTERVTASVLFQRRVDMGRGRYVVVALRRNLADFADETVWTVLPGGGADLGDPQVQAAADQVLAAARAEFDIG